jgi:PPK2 family polyphosphate:nucleotide phosphotransferase
MIDRDKYRIRPDEDVDLSTRDPGNTSGYRDKASAASKLAKDIVELAAVQDVFGAQTQSGLLVVFQGMDTAGKDGAIKHVMSGINPQGVQVYAFKQPSEDERHHDYMWRSMKVAPERGRIGIFNRSYYEEVLVTRVHPELLSDVAVERPDPKFWKRRYEDIVAYERYLVRNGIHVLKFFLHISKEEQERRLLARIDDPDKRWKFNEADVRQRAYWKDYVAAYEKMLGATSTDFAPWYVIPSDHKWFTRVAVADILVAQLKSLKPRYPPVTKEQRAILAREKRLLERK